MRVLRCRSVIVAVIGNLRHNDLKDRQSGYARASRRATSAIGFRSSFLPIIWTKNGADTNAGPMVKWHTLLNGVI
jgi:hypothetical protein